MEFAERVFELHKEIVEDIKNMILKHGAAADTYGGYCHVLDCWGYRFDTLKTIHFAVYSSVLGLRFDTGKGEDSLDYHSAFTIDELANLADALHMYYKD